jgi:NDP-sugar pyrophosphorylase family protein
MKAMVLAAGLGTRLRPLTDDRPKALVEVGGRSMLEITLARLREIGIREVIVNAHHFADQLIHYLRKNHDFGMEVEVSREDILLDTGGGLKKAAWFFSDSRGPFLLHNVDVISNIDLARMVQFHGERNALATLAVQARASSRQLLFDEQLYLCGRRTKGVEQDEMVRMSNNTTALAFAGIHVVSPAIFGCITEQGAFSIISTYLRLAGEGAEIVAFRADEYYWRDVGKAESIRQAEIDMRSGLIHP